MTPEEKRKEETALMTTWLAGVMGWEIEYRKRHVFHNSGNEGYYVNGFTREIVMPVKDFNPTEILEQALEGAFKLGVSVTLFPHPLSHGIGLMMKTEREELLGTSRDTVAEIAYQIVTTLYEEGKS